MPCQQCLKPPCIPFPQNVGILASKAPTLCMPSWAGHAMAWLMVNVMLACVTVPASLLLRHRRL